MGSIQEHSLQPRFLVGVWAEPEACGGSSLPDLCVLGQNWAPDHKGFLEGEVPLVLQSSKASTGFLAPLGSCLLSTCRPFLQLGQARTPSRVAVKPPRPGHRERNKENMSQLNGTTLSGGCTPTAPAQRNYSVNSVASTYSEFAVIHLF